MGKEAKINIWIFSIFLGLLVVVMIYPIVIADMSVGIHNITNESGDEAFPLLTVNEDVEYNYSVTINHTSVPSGRDNITQVNISFGGNFVFTAGSNNSNLSTDPAVPASAFFFNDSSVLSWNRTALNDFVINHTNGSQFFFNLTASTPGTYNLTITLQFNGTDTASFINHTNISIIVNDTTAPHVVNVTDSNEFGLNRSYANVSGTIVINISARDNGNLTAGAGEYDIQSVNISFFNGSDFNFSILSTNVTGKYWNISIDTTILDDGVYNISVFVNDTRNNINSTNVSLNVRVDNKVPTGSISCTPGIVTKGNTVTCSCDVDPDTVSSINATSKNFTTNPETSAVGDFTTKCTFADYSGNEGSASTTYTVKLAGAGPSGGGGTTPSFYTRTITVSEDLETTDITQKLGVKERLRFRVRDSIHTVGIREITVTSALVEIGSHPVQKEINIGEEVRADIDDDGIYDIYVKLNSVINGKADLTIRYIQEEVPTLEPEPTPVVEPEVKEEEKASLAWIWVVAIIIILVIIGWVYYKKRRV